MDDKANVVDQRYEVRLTEWEHDTINKALLGCQYPGTHVDLVYKLMQKMSQVKDILNPPKV